MRATRARWVGEMKATSRDPYKVRRNVFGPRGRGQPWATEESPAVRMVFHQRS
jgi:hypothetical protein